MNKNSKKGMIAIQAIIILLISTVFIVILIPNVRKRVGGITNTAVDGIIATEKKNSGFAADVGQQFVNSNTILTSEDANISKTVLTKKLFFEQDKLDVYTSELPLTLTVLSDPDVSLLTDKKIVWKILKGDNLAKIIKKSDTRSVEITGIEPGLLVLQATSNDTNRRTAYAYITIIQKPTSILLDNNIVSLKVGESTTVKATLEPDDTSDKEILWKYDSSVGTECIDIETNLNEIKITAKKPAGISCDNVTIMMRAQSSDPSVYQQLEVHVSE